MSKKLSVINNVLISQSGNKLKLCDVYFTDTIEEIKPKLSNDIDWKDIKRKGNLKNILTNPSDDVDESINRYDGQYCILMPGGIDPHVHFDTPGFEDRDDFEHASTAAAYGGVTTVIDMPCTSKPPVTSAKNLEKKKTAVKGRSLIDYAFWGGISGNQFDNNENVEAQVEELVQEGVAGFKAYLISGMDSFTSLNDHQMLNAANYVKAYDKVLAVHAEDKNSIEYKQERAKRLRRNSWQDYCFARNDVSEGIAVNKLIRFARISETPIHIVHLSSELGLNAVIKAKSENVKITAETCPHYLQFIQKNFENPKISKFLKTAPPVKKEEDRKALWNGLQSGYLEFITTDHAGCVPDKEKKADTFWEVYAGIPGVEHRVPFIFSEGFIKGDFTLGQTIELLTTNAAEFFKLNKKGKLQKGYDADFILINPWTKSTIRSTAMHSKGKYTPFNGYKLHCTIQKTFLRGNLVMNRDGDAEKKIGYGKFLKVI